MQLRNTEQTPATSGASRMVTQADNTLDHKMASIIAAQTQNSCTGQPDAQLCVVQDNANKLPLCSSRTDLSLNSIRQALDRYICNFTWNPIKEVHVYVSLFLYSCHRDEKMETETMHLRGGGIAEGFLDIYIFPSKGTD